MVEKASTSVSPGQIAGDHQPLPFEKRLALATADPQLGKHLLNFQRSWRESRDAAFDLYRVNPLASAGGDLPNDVFAALRDELRPVKDAVVANLPEYVDRFQREAESRGFVVHRADTARDACRYVVDLCRKKGITLAVKSKSMVSEEIFLNAALEEAGIRAVETDLGEWIQQLAHERPSHMVMPAIHKTRRQVADLFTDTLHRPIDREDIGAQVETARVELRREFFDAGLGINGANALIASTGTVLYISNEGNARLATTLPPVQVVLAGIEKLLPDHAAAMLQLRVLARSATGQQITSYSTFLSGPPEPGKEVHIVLIDNGRLAMRDTPLINEALRCIRCAACANVCPPYGVVGGHVFGHIYSGAIGLVNTAFHHGLDAAAGPNSLCVSCNACATVCPVDIPLPRQILAVRSMAFAKNPPPLPVRLVLKLWSSPGLSDRAMRLAATLSSPYRRRGLLRLPSVAALFPAIRRQTAWRTPPAPAKRPARDLLAKRPAPAIRLDTPARGKRIAFFIQCLTDRLMPEIALSAAGIFDACGIDVVTPADQHCCGLPAFDAGDRETARKMAMRTIEALEQAEADYVITAGVSCVVMLLHEAHDLFDGLPGWQARCRALSSKMMDFTTFLDRVVQLRPGSLTLNAGAVTYHTFCQSANILQRDEPDAANAHRRLLEGVLGLELRDLPEGSVCCGFGGSTSAVHAEVSKSILARKLENVSSTGARLLVTDNPGCLMHLRGGIDAAGLPIRVMHPAQLLARALYSQRTMRAD